jgi:hypothetical protein
MSATTSTTRAAGTGPTRSASTRPTRRPGRRPAPTQWPFSLNDPRRTADRRAGVYHWTPPLADIQDPQQEREHQMGHLDDLATGNPRVRRALRDSFGYWIRAVGVDAFRVDTAFYVEPEFFHDFIHSRDRRAPGMAEVARRTGRQDFYVFGEGFGIDAPGATAQAERIEGYVRGADGQPRMQGMLNFPLYGGLVDAFARGRPTQELRERIEAVMRVHGDPHRMPSFVDNHDVDRWLAGGSEAGLRQALLAIMTLPGVPVLYYGTEQGLKAPSSAARCSPAASPAAGATLGMHRVTQGWNPANGFDRVAFSVFIGLPGQPEGNGARVLPLQRAELPEGMRWHRRLRAHGWSNALFAWPGASASADGTPAAPAARIEVDRERHMVRFTLPAAALGRLDKLSGAQVYVTTWDYDAGWRALLREAGPFHFGGATGDDDALVMDDSGVMTLR